MDTKPTFDYAQAELAEVSCNLCGGTDVSVLARRDRYGLPVRSVVCRRCGLAYISPRMGEEWYRRFYREGHYRDLCDRFRGLRRTRSIEDFFERAYRFGTALARRVQGFVLPGFTIEVGSGSGGILAAWRDELGGEVLGIEPSEGESAFARLRGIATETTLFERLATPFKPAANILSIQSLNHLLDPRAFLVWAHGALRPDGRLILVVNNFRTVCHKTGSPTRAVQVDHPFMFMPETLKLFVEAAGFDVIRLEDWGNEPGQVPGITTESTCLLAEKSERKPFAEVALPPGQGQRVLASLQGLRRQRLRALVRRFLTPRLFAKPIFWILAGAFVLRLWGIDYGLPLLLVNDEPAIILGALKMIELQNPIPVINDAEFRRLLYYPPFPSQVLAVALLPVIGVHYFLLGAPPLDEYRALVALDPTAIWIGARVLWVLIGIAMIFLTYLLARTLLRSERAGLLAAIFLALSPYHIYLSQTVRHWLPAALVIVLLAFLAVRIRQGVAGTGRYLAAGLIAGIAAGGINAAGVVGLLWPLAAHLTAVGGESLWHRLASRKLWLLLLAFALAAGFFVAIYPYGLTRGELGADVSATGYLGSRWERLGDMDWVVNFLSFKIYGGIFWRYEIILTLVGLAGMILLLRDRTRRFWALTFIGHVFIYFLLFYFLFNPLPRGIIFLLPFLAVFAGYAAERILLWSQNIVRPTVAGMFLVFGFWSLVLFGWPLVTDLRYAWVLSRPDTRLEAREWIAGNLPPGTAILLDSQYLRLPSTPESVRELAGIDGRALRAADRAVLVLPAGERPQPAYRVLNLHFLSPERPERTIADPEPFRRGGFRYLVVEHVRRDQGDLRPETRALAERSRRIAFFDPWSDASHPESLTASGEIASAPLTSLFVLERFGRFITVYELGGDSRR